MRKFSNIISLAACFVLLWGCDEYDDGELRQNIDAIEQELTETEKRVERLNEEMNSLSALINSSFISYLKQDDEGNYIFGFMQDQTGEKLYAVVQSAVDAARKEGAKYVIAMAKRRPLPSPRRTTW